MKVIQIYKPVQDENTKPEDLELVEEVSEIRENGAEFMWEKTPYWMARTENVKLGDTYLMWLHKKENEIKGEEFVKKGVEGIYLLDIQTVLTANNEPAMMIRYDYIYKHKYEFLQAHNLH